MKKKSLFYTIYRQLRDRNFFVFILVYVICFICLYPYKYKLNGYYEEGVQSLPLTAIISIFPAAFLVPIVEFLKKNKTTFWLKPLIEIVYLVASANGSISEKDRKIIERSLKKQLGNFKYVKAHKYFSNIENNQTLNIGKSCARLKEVFQSSEATVFMDMLVQITLSDQYLSLEEEELLYDVCKRLGLNNNTLKIILSRKNYISEKDRDKQNFVKPSHSFLSKSYKILGLSEFASIKEVKKAYHGLAKLYHPDKIRDKKLRQKAKKQFQEIVEAYEIVKRHT